MAFPWNRRDAKDQLLPSERRRRSRSRRNRQLEEAPQDSQAERERRHQRMVWAIGAALVLLIVAVVAAGVYDKFLRPPRVWAGSVRDAEFSMGDLVKRIRVLQGVTGEVNLSIIPFEYLQDLLNAEVLRQASAGLGISISDADVDRALRSQFLPQAVSGEDTAPDQLQEEFREAYSGFLTRTGLSDKDYRGIIKEQLSELNLRGILAASIEDSQEQVEVEWIRLDPAGQIDPGEVRARLDIEEFNVVASDVNLPAGFSREDGYVGWLPRAAFPELEDAIFGNEDKDVAPLAEVEFSDPVFTSTGIYILHGLSAPEQRELSNIMQFKINTEQVSLWYQNQLVRGGEDGWLRMNFNSDLYQWVAEQVDISSPRDQFPR
jgi:hypothetical protein